MNWARAFFGIIIVAAGSLLLLDSLDLLDASEVIGDSWPAAPSHSSPIPVIG